MYMENVPKFAVNSRMPISLKNPRSAIIMLHILLHLNLQYY